MTQDPQQNPFLNPNASGLDMGQDPKQQRNRKLELVMQSAGIGVWEWDVANNKIMWNDQMYILYGVSKDTFATTYESWQKAIHPEDRKTTDEAFQTALKSANNLNIVFRVILPNDDVRYHKLNGIVERGNNNEPINILGVVFDVTEQRLESEEQTKLLNDVKKQAQTLLIAKAKDEAILAGIGEGIITTNSGGIIEFVNEAATKMLGYSKEEMIGKTITEVLKMVDEDHNIIPLSQRPMVMALFSGQETNISLGKTYYYYRKDGTSFPVGISVAPFVFGGTITGSIEIFRDITIEKEIDKEKTEFVSLASHQLKTPIGAMRWTLEMLLAGDYGTISDEQKKVLNEIYTMNKRMYELISSLLNISRIEMGVFIIEPKPTDFAKLCDEVLVEMESRRVQKEHEVIKDFESNLPIVPADEKLLRIIFQNFISNAIKYTKDHGKIRVTLKSTIEDIIFSVSNNGDPIPESEQSRIFQKMFRASNAQEQDTDGNGLGLYVVKQIVDNGGGKTWFTSKEGEDTVFSCSFPLSGMLPKAGTKQLSE